MRKKRDIWQEMDMPDGKEKCSKCGHSAFKSHNLKIPKNKYDPIKATCKYCKCKGILKVE